MSGKDTLFDRIGQFTTIPNSVIKLWPVIGIDAMGIFVYLRFRSDEHDTSFPSLDLMQKDTGLTRKRIVKAIKVLEANGLLERQKRFSQSTIYTLRLPSISATGTLMESSISATGTLPLVQQVHANQTHLTRPINNIYAKNGTPENMTPVSPFNGGAQNAPHTQEDIRETSHKGPEGSQIKPPVIQERIAQYDVRMFSESIRPLALAFCQNFRRGPMNNGEVKFWSKTLREFVKSGISSDMIDEAFRMMKRDGLVNFKSPESIRVYLWRIKVEQEDKSALQAKFQQIQNLPEQDSLAQRAARGEKVDVYKPVVEIDLTQYITD